MKRAAMTSAVFLMVSLGAAWFEWTSEEAVDLEGKVVLLQGDAAEITAVRWVSEDTEATIARQSDDLGSYFWVDYVRWSERKLPADRATDDTGEAEKTTERVASRSAFKSAGKSDDLMATLSPMVAQRSLVVTTAMLETPYSPRVFADWISPGRWRSVQVGVKAPTCGQAGE